MDVSIIIVSFNVKEYLEKCLASVYRETRGLSFEIFVVDNASSDDSVGMVRELFPEVMLILNRENYGFAAANNSALKECTGNFVLFLNPDTEIKENAIEKLLKYMKANPSVAVAAPKLLNEDGSLQLLSKKFPSLYSDYMEALFLDAAFPKSKIFNPLFMGLWPHDSTRDVDQPAGACLLVSMYMLIKAGFYDENFFMYYEDVDLCLRIKKAGGRIVFLHDAAVVHHGGKSSEQQPAESDRRMAEGRVKYYRKHYGRPGMLVFGCNLIIRTFMVYICFTLTHIMFGRPKNIRIMRDRVKYLWQEYLKK